jgi:arylsulfatase A-like enzyme
MAANRSQPFFLYMAYTIPHLVWEVPADSLREYDTAFPEKPDRPRKSDAMVIEKPFATYAAMVTRLDREVGRVFQKLRDLGLDQNTVVFFCSDNGAPDRTPVAFFQSNGPFRGFKGSLYEGGIHTEMIVRWPGQIPAGKRSGFAWAGWDLLPTAAELAGASAPAALDGISVVPALLGKATLRPGYLYWEIPAGSLAQAVREGDLKAIRLSSDQPVAVYDLAKDPGEQHDVASTHREFVSKAGEIFREARTPSEDWPVGQEPGAKPGKKKDRR